jgi:solute carrier family 25 folate transporter 32
MPPDLSHLTAGAGAGCAATLLLHPLDLIKTRMQVQEHGCTRLPTYRGVWHACRKIVSVEGWLGLYQGLSPNLLGNTASWGLYMWLYNEGKVSLKRRTSWSDSSVYLGAATGAGVLTSLIMHPVFTIKTRLQLQLRETAAELPSQLLPMAQRDNYDTALNAAVRMVREEGLLSLYRGIGPSLLLVSHASLQFLTYEQLKTAFTARRLPADNLGRDSAGAGAKLSAADLAVAATVSKVLATIVTYPYQVVRSCMQQRSVVGDSKLQYETFVETVMHLWRVDGFYGFYRGLFAHILRSTPQASVTLLAYEYIHRAVCSMSSSRRDGAREVSSR